MVMITIYLVLEYMEYTRSFGVHSKDTASGDWMNLSEVRPHFEAISHAFHPYDNLAFGDNLEYATNYLLVRLQERFRDVHFIIESVTLR